MKWQRKSSKLGEKHIVKGRENPQWSSYQKTPTTKYQETHTKANDGVGRPKGEHSKVDDLTKTTCSNVTQHKRDASSIAFGGQRICTRVTHSLTLAVQALSQPTRDETWHHLILFFSLLFFDFCFLTMIPSLLLVPRSLTIHTRQYFKIITRTSAMHRNIKELVR